MRVLAGLFLVAHGLVHLAVWVAPPAPDAPFDSRRSWLAGDVRRPAVALAIIACSLFVFAGALVLAGAASAGGTAIAAAAVSTLLVLLTFNRWLVFALAINAAVIAVAAG